MKYIYQAYIAVTQFVLSDKSIKQSVFFGLMAVVLLLVSYFTPNHAVGTISGIISGLAFGIFLIKMQPVINYFKKKQLNAAN